MSTMSRGCGIRMVAEPCCCCCLCDGIVALTDRNGMYEKETKAKNDGSFWKKVETNKANSRNTKQEAEYQFEEPGGDCDDECINESSALGHIIRSTTLEASSGLCCRLYESMAETQEGRCTRPSYFPNAGKRATDDVFGRENEWLPKNNTTDLFSGRSFVSYDSR